MSTNIQNADTANDGLNEYIAQFNGVFDNQRTNTRQMYVDGVLVVELNADFLQAFKDNSAINNLVIQEFGELPDAPLSLLEIVVNAACSE